MPLKDLKSHLETKCGDGPCPLCGGGDWQIAPESYILVRKVGAEGFSGLPVRVTICKECGYTAMVCTELIGGESDE